MPLVIVGLGNPGNEYKKTRHNAGFMVVDHLSEKLGFPKWKKKNNHTFTEGVYQNSRIVLAKPQTYMNLSGNAVLSLMTRYKVPIGDFLVIVDDFAIPFGKIRFRPDGGNGGHNGLLSIIEKTGRKDFPRLRIGIGPLPLGIDTADFVLSSFLPDEKKKLPEIIKTSANGVLSWVEDGMERAMNTYNSVLI